MPKETDMIRVLHFISDSNIGGAGRLLVHCLRHFDRTRFDVAVVLPRGSALLPLIAETGTRVIETDAGRDASHEKGAVSAFYKIIRAEKPLLFRRSSKRSTPRPKPEKLFISTDLSAFSLRQDGNTVLPFSFDFPFFISFFAHFFDLCIFSTRFRRFRFLLFGIFLWLFLFTNQQSYIIIR